MPIITKNTKSIKVGGCHNCVFKYVDYNDFSVGNDTVEICMLAQYDNLPDYFIDSYDSKRLNSDGEPERNMVTPEWCPLKINDVRVSLKI